jgi:hypothetical protein
MGLCCGCCSRRQPQDQQLRSDALRPLPRADAAAAWGRLASGLLLRSSRRRLWSSLGRYLQAVRTLELTHLGRRHLQELGRRFAALGRSLRRR